MLNHVLIQYNFKCGEYELQAFTSTEVPKEASTEEIESAVRENMEQFYGDCPDVDGDVIYFFGGEISITIQDYTVLSYRDYCILRKHNIIH